MSGCYRSGLGDQAELLEGGEAVGMSLGGLTAIALGAEAPELVRKLVLFG